MTNELSRGGTAPAEAGTTVPDAPHQARARPLVASGPDVLLGPAGTPFPIRTLVPRLELADIPELGPSMQWRTGRGGISEDLHDILWQFVELGDAPDASILAFARRYGVLAGVAAPEPVQRRPELRGWELRGGTEPLTAWRGVANGVAALLDMATDLALPTGSDNNRRGEDQLREQTFAAVDALTTLKWLLDADRDWPLPDPKDAPAAWLLLELEGLGPPSDARSRLRWFVNRFLAETQVQLLAAVVTDAAGDRFSLPALTVDRLEQLPRRPGESDVYWRLPALLSVLTVALARAVEPGKFARCSYCGRLARIMGRRPDPRRAWFGDHNYCRRRSRTEVMREVNRRHRARLAAQRTES